MSDLVGNDEYLRTDEAEEAVSSLESAAEFLAAVRSDPYRWTWVILALHSAVQGFMILALRGGNGLLPFGMTLQRARCIRKWGVPSREKLDNFQIYTRR
jgi:hypothetical protein